MSWLRQYVPDAHETHHQMRVLGRACSHKPRCTRHVGDLVDQQYGAVLRVLPEGLSIVETTFLNGAVSRIGRIGSSKSSEPARKRIGNVQERVALGIGPAIVHTELGLRMRYELKTSHEIAGVDLGYRYVKASAGTGYHRADDRLWRQTVNVPSHAIAPHAAGHKAEVPAFSAFDQIKIQSAKKPAANGRMGMEGRSCRRDDSSLHCGLQATSFEVEVPAPGGIVGVIGE